MEKETEIVFDYNRMSQEDNLDSSLPSPSENTRSPSRTYSWNGNFLEILKKHSVKILKYLLILIIFSWYIISIISLIETSYVKERNLCSFSDLWLYLLISLIIDVGFLESIKRYIWDHNGLSFEEIPTCYLIRFEIKCSLIFIWGTLILYPFSCTDKLKNTMLFWTTLYNYLLNFIFGGLTGIVILRRFFGEVPSEEITNEQILSSSEELRRGEIQSPRDGEEHYSLEV